MSLFMLEPVLTTISDGVVEGERLLSSTGVT
jgi:hypothetical protein